MPCAISGPSDVLIVLGGEISGERTRQAANLYKQGLAPKVLLSDGTMLSWRTATIDEMYDLAVQEGVNIDDIITETKSRSTYENALYTKQIAVGNGYKSAIVVTTDWHAKRSSFIFSKIYEGSGVRLAYCGTPGPASDFEEWWKDGEKQQTVLTEWAKTIVYWVKY